MQASPAAIAAAPASAFRHDPALVEIVYREQRADCQIVAILTRFGGLSVQVDVGDAHSVWMGENILDARAWVDARAS